MLKNKKGIAFFLMLFILLTFFIVFLTESTEARVGGGHSFRGSSGGSSRSYGSGYMSRGSSYSSSSGVEIQLILGALYLFGIFISVLLLSDLCYRFLGIIGLIFCWLFGLIPFISIFASPIVILLLLYHRFFDYVIKVFSSYRFTAKLIEAFKESPTDENNIPELKDISPITGKDSNFSEVNFIDRAKKAFALIQQANTNRDLSKVQSFLADGIYEYLQIQVNNMISSHEIDYMGEINIKRAVIVKLDTNENYDSIYVAFTVEAVNYRMDDRTKEFKNGSKAPETFTEVWCFMRRSGAKTINGNGLIEGFCPNCGNPMEGSRFSKCPNCDSLLLSGQHDWILTGIIQRSEWINTTNTNIPGYAKLQEKDPKFNIAHIEDKLALMFWRMVEAVKLKKSEPVRKVSTDAFAEEFERQKGNEAFPALDETALGSTRIVGIVDDDPEYDFLLGQLTWSGQIVGSSDYEYKKSCFVLRRKKDVATDPGKCFCSAHCPSCGAPMSDTSKNSCEYCGSILNDDSKDWMLTEVMSFHHKRVKEYLARAKANGNDGFEAKLVIGKNETAQPLNNEVRPKNIDYSSISNVSGIDLLRLTVAVMLADGVIDENEMSIIRNICKIRGISKNELSKCIDTLKTKEEPIAYILESCDIELNENLMRLLIEIAAADGEIADSEINMLYKVAGKMGLSEKRLRELINSAYTANWENRQ